MYKHHKHLQMLILADSFTADDDDQTLKMWIAQLIRIREQHSADMTQTGVMQRN